MHRGAAVLCLLALALAAPGQDAPRPKEAHWPHWRGPTEQGHSPDMRVPLTWSEKENIAWKVEVPGAGNSTPIIWGDRIFLTASSDRGRERYVLCFRTTDGQLLWKQTAAKAVPFEKSHNWNGHASGSCATDGKHVYALFGTPGLFCYSVEGKPVWQKQFGKFTSKTGWGTGASPYLFGDLVIANCDNDGGPGAAPAALVALDKLTGKQRWSTPRNQGKGYGTPRLLVRATGRLDLLLNGPDGLWAYDPATGLERWRITRSHPGEQHKFGEPMPVDDGQLLYVASGRPGPFQIVRLPEAGNATRTNVVYQGTRSKHRDVASPLLHDGLVYALDKDGVLSCIELKTGKEIYTQRLAVAKSLASPVMVRGHILFLLDNGLTIVLKPGRTFEVAGRNRLGAGSSLEFAASPAIADGRLFLRSQTHLYCIAQK